MPFYVIFTQTYKGKKPCYSKACHRLGKLSVASKKKIAALNYTPENSPSSLIITESFHLAQACMNQSPFCISKH